MGPGVDTSQRKPRRVRGTPAAAFRNRLALAVIGLGALAGLAFHFVPVSEPLRKATTSVLYFEPEGESDRKKLIASSLNVRRPESIRKHEETQARIDLPHK